MITGQCIYQSIVYFTSGTIKNLPTPQLRHQPPFHVAPPIKQKIATLPGGPIIEGSSSLC